MHFSYYNLMILVKVPLILDGIEIRNIDLKTESIGLESVFSRKLK